MILFYAFSNSWGTNISHRVLLDLSKRGISGTFYPIHGYPHQFFQKYLKNSQYDFIVGLGDGGKFLSKIHIETLAKNSYLNHSINPLLPISLELSLPVIDLYDPQYFSISDKMGTYNCNYLAFLTQHQINTHSPSTRHLFLHLPPRQNAALLAQKIFDLILANHLLTF